jgi:predicted ribosome quality control (RQC) complex YloA/Tae2 family protein
MVAIVYTASGAEVLIGRNAAENDKLTMTHPAKDDMWFHVADAPGSHVILVGSTDHKDIKAAARIAVQYSKHKSTSAATVHYCRVGDVHKHSTAPAGQVSMARQRQLLVKV